MDKQEIVTKSKEILKRMGKDQLWSDKCDSDGDPIVYGCTYYSYKNLYILDRGKDHVSISFGGVDVFDSRTDFCQLLVMWEDLLDEIYKSLNGYTSEDVRECNKELVALNFCKNIVNKVYNDSYSCSGYWIRFVNGLKDYGIEVSKNSISEDLYEQHDYYKIMEIKFNNETVLKTSQHNYGKNKVVIFKPGSWMETIINYKEYAEKYLRYEEVKDADYQPSNIDDELERMKRKYFNH